MREDFLVCGGYDVDRLFQVEGIDRDIADVCYLKARERRCSGRHIVRAQHAGFRADLTGTMARARPIGRADVHRNSDEASVETGGVLLLRKAHHGSGAAETWHFVSAERLVQVILVQWKNSG